MTRVSTCLVLLLSLSLFSPERPLCQEKTSIVVLPFTGGELSEADLAEITLLFEENLLKVESFQVIDQAKRARVLAYLNPSLLKCEDIECALKAAKALSADTAVLGTVTRRGETLVISARAVNVKSGKSVRAESVESASKADLPRTIRILSSTLLGTPMSGASIAEGPNTEQENLQRLRALESLRADLNEAIAEIKEKRVTAHRWGWALVGVSAASAALSGVSWYLSDVAYQHYQSTSDTDLAAYYRGKVTLWDTLFLVSAGTGVLSIGGSIPIFTLGPNSRAEAEELKKVEAEIRALESAREAGK
jgi:TolB-like protein